MRGGTGLVGTPCAPRTRASDGRYQGDERGRREARLSSHRHAIRRTVKRVARSNSPAQRGSGSEERHN
eukprot:3452127-Heterocapsa_arctica.AAC.1